MPEIHAGNIAQVQRGAPLVAGFELVEDGVDPYDEVAGGPCRHTDSPGCIVRDYGISRGERAWSNPAMDSDGIHSIHFTTNARAAIKDPRGRRCWLLERGAGPTNEVFRWDGGKTLDKRIPIINGLERDGEPIQFLPARLWPKHKGRTVRVTDPRGNRRELAGFLIEDERGDIIGPHGDDSMICILIGTYRIRRVSGQVETVKIRSGFIVRSGMIELGGGDLASSYPV